MVGLPGQKIADLAADLAFFKEIGADMIGIGPYITEPGTPVAARWEEEFGGGGEVRGGVFGGGSGVGVGVGVGGVSGGGGDGSGERADQLIGDSKRAHMEAMVSLTTRVNALARITLGNVNVAATTALQALHPRGRELALRRGANVLMPILTPTGYRADYSLYEGKPCITDTAAGCEACLSARVGEWSWGWFCFWRESERGGGEKDEEKEKRERKRETKMKRKRRRRERARKEKLTWIAWLKNKKNTRNKNKRASASPSPAGSGATRPMRRERRSPILSSSGRRRRRRESARQRRRGRGGAAAASLASASAARARSGKERPLEAGSSGGASLPALGPPSGLLLFPLSPRAHPPLPFLPPLRDRRARERDDF